MGENHRNVAEERRLVTILFADVTGSTELGETLDPEDVRALLSRFYNIAKDVIAVHGGTLEKFIGDAVMAVFGLPQAHGDDAQRALSAALELRELVRADAALGARLPIRVGVNTGEVVATRDVSAGDFMITGDPVNVAARLQQAAESWGILCSERTARAAGRAFAFAPLVDIEARGKRSPISARPVVGHAAPSVPRRVPLIGRDADLAQLELVARRAFTERRPYLVSLIAPAGTGKTRLLEEFLDRLSGTAPAVTVAIAQCLPYGQRLTYWPLRSVLFRLIGVSEDAVPDVVRDALHRWLLDAGVESAARVEEFLAATVGLGEAEVADRDALFAAWRTTVEVAARRAPLVLVFEDLHWSSDSLLDLVEFVMQPRGDSSVLMLALTRPELLDRRPTWGGGRRNYVSLALEPLSDDAVAALVEHLLGRPSAEVISRVVARAEGNPFYAGEIVRSIMERVGSVHGQEAIERALATLPDTVQATVLARLDLLETSERRVLQLGAVFGRSFRTAEIAALAPNFAADVPHLADRLVARDLIRPSDTDHFSFRHILIREVAYQTLARAERARLHAAAGAWLEGQTAGLEDVLTELIAYHYREAAALAGALEIDAFDARGIRKRAAHWLARAADVVAAGAATGEAARHLRGAIELAEPQALPELYERLGLVLSWGNVAAEAFRTALQLCREAQRPPDQELRVLAALLTLYTRFQGSVGARPSEKEIRRLRADGRALMARASDQRATAAFLIAEAFFPFWLGGALGQATPAELTEAEASVRRGLEIAEQLDDARLRSAALDGLGSVHQERGAWEAVRESQWQRLAFQERLDLGERIDAYSMVTWASARLGDLVGADRVSEEGLALLQPEQVTAYALHLAAWRLYALTLRGRWDEASAGGERACQLWMESGITAAGFAARGFMAALDVARGRRDERLIERYRGVLKEILENLSAVSPTKRMLPYLTIDLEALDAQVVRGFDFSHSHLVEYVERTVSLCVDWGRPPAPEVIRPIAEFAAAYRYKVLEAQVRRALGVASRDTGELSRSLEIFEQIGAVPYAARVRCERGLLTGNGGDLSQGMRMLETLGDVDQLNRVETANRSH